MVRGVEGKGGGFLVPRRRDCVAACDPGTVRQPTDAAESRRPIYPQSMKRTSQLALPLPSRGGRRPGAGRKPKGEKPLVSHKARVRFDQPAAVHVTMRVALHVWNLRSRRCFRLIEIALADARGRFGLRVVEFSVLGNHLHLVVEADSSAALSRGMQGLSIRIARALNRLMRRRGSVFADHYHPRILRSPTELVGAIAYVLGNAQHHYGISGPDP